MWRLKSLLVGTKWFTIIIIGLSILFIYFYGNNFSYIEYDSDNDGSNRIMIDEHGHTTLSYSRIFETRAEIDSDTDGINDTDDAFPLDPAASKDTDTDGCPDEWNPGYTVNDSTSNPRLHLDMFPFDTAACLDTDGDNLPDKLIAPSITLIEDTDDDNDGMPDQWELDYSLDPTDSGDALTDLDFDGFSNLNEYISNTSPIDPFDYPTLNIDPPQRNRDDWGDFVLILIFILLPAFIIAIIIGILIIRSRRYDEDFWSDTFGEDNVDESELDYVSRKRYREWLDRVESEGSKSGPRKAKYKLEIIGGPDDDEDIIQGRLSDLSSPSQSKRRKTSQNKKRMASGKYCLWCDKGISKKYIKRCPERLFNERRCPDGPFCSKKCLNDHLNTVPHYHEVNF
jgi:hypothetical protein